MAEILKLVITKDFKEIIANMDESLQDKVLHNIQNLLAKMKRDKIDLPKMLELLDEYNLASTSTDIKCGKGNPCNGCCSQNVDISLEELRLIATPEYLEYEVPNKERDNDKRWLQHRPCFFLKKGRCSVYKNRPIACRELWVVSDPKHCHGDGIEPVSFYVHSLPQMLITAWRTYRQTDLPDNMDFQKDLL